MCAAKMPLIKVKFSEKECSIYSLRQKRRYFFSAVFFVFNFYSSSEFVLTSQSKCENFQHFMKKITVFINNDLKLKWISVLSPLKKQQKLYWVKEWVFSTVKWIDEITELQLLFFFGDNNHNFSFFGFMFNMGKSYSTSFFFFL